MSPSLWLRHKVSRVYSNYTIDRQSDDQGKKAKKPASNKLPASSKSLRQPKQDSPMDKFNNALQKIVSAPKKNLKQK